MGMFDYVEAEHPCWRCHKTLDTFQTKDDECIMVTLTPDHSTLQEYYNICHHCTAWNEYQKQDDGQWKLAEQPRYGFIYWDDNGEAAERRYLRQSAIDKRDKRD